MKVGDDIDIEDYDELAVIEFKSGEGYVLVLCNNSSHFLVATRHSDDGRTFKHQLVREFSYADAICTEQGQEETGFQYELAVKLATSTALAR